MYSAASRPPRVAGARPSRRSEDKNRKCPSISCGVIGAALEDDCAIAGAAAMQSEKRVVMRVIVLRGLRFRSS